MFDVNHVANTLKSARIKKNLTQSDLADKIGVSYQAVSNWERGQSVPDISNLSALCDVLDLNLYELIGATQNKEFEDEIRSGSVDLGKLPIKNIASIAAILPPEELMSIIRENRSSIDDMATLIQIAPFVDGDLLEEIGKSLTPSSVGEIVALSPFVSSKTCAIWLDKLDDFSDFDLDIGLLSALSPFLSREKMDQLSEKVVPESLVMISAVAPFLSRKALDGLVNRVETLTMDDYTVGLACLSPFLSKDAIKSLHRKVTPD